jgi:hypothetical protein
MIVNMEMATTPTPKSRKKHVKTRPKSPVGTTSPNPTVVTVAEEK